MDVAVGASVGVWVTVTVGVLVGGLSASATTSDCCFTTGSIFTKAKTATNTMAISSPRLKKGKGAASRLAPQEEQTCRSLGTRALQFLQRVIRGRGFSILYAVI